MPRRRRLSCAADLFLDTIYYNAHATAADALAVGLPVVTLNGGSFAARVGASLLKAAGLDELIAETPGAYLAIARRVAADPAATKARLAAAQKTAPLFDPARLVAELEDAYRRLSA
jgi:protein O-GlcNAc transferase